MHHPLILVLHWTCVCLCAAAADDDTVNVSPCDREIYSFRLPVGEAPMEGEGDYVEKTIRAYRLPEYADRMNRLMRTVPLPAVVVVRKEHREQLSRGEEHVITKHNHLYEMIVFHTLLKDFVYSKTSAIFQVNRFGKQIPQVAKAQKEAIVDVFNSESYRRFFGSEQAPRDMEFSLLILETTMTIKNHYLVLLNSLSKNLKWMKGELEKMSQSDADSEPVNPVYLKKLTNRCFSVARFISRENVAFSTGHIEACVESFEFMSDMGLAGFKELYDQAKQRELRNVDVCKIMDMEEKTGKKSTRVVAFVVANVAVEVMEILWRIEFHRLMGSHPESMFYKGAETPCHVDDAGLDKETVFLFMRDYGTASASKASRKKMDALMKYAMEEHMRLFWTCLDPAPEIEEDRQERRQGVSQRRREAPKKKAPELRSLAGSAGLEGTSKILEEVVFRDRGEDEGKEDEEVLSGDESFQKVRRSPKKKGDMDPLYGFQRGAGLEIMVKVARWLPRSYQQYLDSQELGTAEERRRMEVARRLHDIPEVLGVVRDYSLCMEYFRVFQMVGEEEPKREDTRTFFAGATMLFVRSGRSFHGFVEVGVTMHPDNRNVYRVGHVRLSSIFCPERKASGERGDGECVERRGRIPREVCRHTQGRALTMRRDNANNLVLDFYDEGGATATRRLTLYNIENLDEEDMLAKIQKAIKMYVVCRKTNRSLIEVARASEVLSRTLRAGVPAI